MLNSGAPHVCSATADSSDANEGVTLMVRNIPPMVTQTQLIDAIDKLGLRQYVTLLYLPINFKKASNKGFAFIHMSSSDAAEMLLAEWHHKFVFGRVRGRRALNIGHAHTQGHTATLNRWMHSTTCHIRNPQFAPLAHAEVSCTLGLASEVADPTET